MEGLGGRRGEMESILEFWWFAKSTYLLRDDPEHSQASSSERRMCLAFESGNFGFRGITRGLCGIMIIP